MSYELRTRSRNYESRAAELRTSNFRAANFESSPATTNLEPPSCELRIQPRNQESRATQLRTSNPAPQLSTPRRRVARIESLVPPIQISSPRTPNPEFPSPEHPLQPP